MKKLITVILGLTCIVAFSFFKNAQKLGYTKLATNLYVARTVVPMSDANKAKLKEILTKEYGIKSFDQDVTVGYKKVSDSKNPKLTGFNVAERTIGASVFTQSMVNKPSADVEVTQRGMWSSVDNVASVTAITYILESYKN
jgi:hypothetical protein